MKPPAPYELLDFGAGRKLERFGAFVLDRPAPAAEGIDVAEPALWQQATARYERRGEVGHWLPRAALPETWPLQFEPFTLELKPTEFGHLGIFPEQAENWAWIAAQVRASPQPCKVLNLFAYTGGSTLAAAAAGAEVVHVDAAKNVVAWARQNAERSGLEAAPIRWICEDAAKFVRRERKRGHRYDAVILDPPSFGRGPAGQFWKLAEDLPRLLADCCALTGGTPRFMLVTAHTTGLERSQLAGWLHAGLGQEAAPLESSELAVKTQTGRALVCGVLARVAR
ncbi:MAG TPA: class I SAM-dependent methyltransferase [Pirellulales bacterium]|jgi:23S rRNA (cytosine1962-C5)-methyltransferase|nr:class I SAM-dependent methyltransferase [Pirellulales bacterium]